MGLMLSLLIGCAGVIEAIACYRTINYGILPPVKPNFDNLRRSYDTMFAQSLARESRADAWKLGPQGYLEIKGGGKSGPIKASIKFLGAENDSTPILFSTKISSFGQDSLENEITSTTPERTTVKTQIPQNNSYHVSHRPSPAQSHENVWNDESNEQKEKIKWHYRPITPIEDSSLPEIHFDSYERNDSTNSDEFLRSLDGIKFRPLQRDDGTGRRRSFKKRHSSSSTSSRESKASREEELKMFTSLEESELENNNANKYSSAPNLTTDSASRHRSKSRSPSNNLTADDSFASGESKSPSIERPHLKDLPKDNSFDEASELIDDNAVGTKEIEDDGSTVIFRKTGVNR